jgi:Fe-Mn family superoxide dismutase
MYEHSYHIDFGTKAAAYVDDFMANMNWNSVMKKIPASRSRALACGCSVMLVY